MTNRYTDAVDRFEIYEDWQGNRGFLVETNPGSGIYTFMSYLSIVPIRMDITKVTILSGERYWKARL